MQFDRRCLQNMVCEYAKCWVVGVEKHERMCGERESREGPNQVRPHPNPWDPEPKTIGPPLQPCYSTLRWLLWGGEDKLCGMGGSVCLHVVSKCTAVCFWRDSVCVHVYSEGLTTSVFHPEFNTINKGKSPQSLLFVVECNEVYQRFTLVFMAKRGVFSH